MSEISCSPAALFLSSFSPNIDTPVALPDDEGQTVAGYVLGPVVGRGGFSTIRTGTSSSGDVVAIKIVRRSDVSSQPNPDVEAKRLDHEAQVWSSLHHEHILPLFKSDHTSYADYFITQFCPAGSLFDILKRDGTPALPHDDVGMMFRQVVRGLQYLHDIMGYVHGDIKLENVLVDEMGVCKLADFGMTRRIGEIGPIIHDQHDHEIPTPSRRHSRAAGLTSHRSLRHKATDPSRHTLQHRNSAPLRGSPAPQQHQGYQQGSLPYASPELLLPHGGSPYVPHPAQDIWALGVMLYGLLTGRLPFTDAFEPRLQMKILHGAYEMPTDIGPAAERVLAGCLDMNVASRWTIAMVDEDAWGIGWASGDSTPSSDHGVDCDPGRTHSRTRTISVVISDSESPPHSHNDMFEESPLPGRRSRGSPSSSRSRSPSELLSFMPASLTSLNDSILGADMRNLSNPSAAHSLARGRSRTKASPEKIDTRSLSPGMTPLTPPDLIGESAARSHGMRTYGTDIPHENDTGRSRTTTSRLRWRGTDLGDIEEISAREKWSASRSRHSSRSRLRDDDGLRGIERRAFDLLNKWDETSRGRSLRAGSQPPRSSSSASREKRLRETGCDWASWRASSAIRDRAGEETVERMKVRSRSVEFDFRVDKGRTRKLAPL
ncbi:kinase-like protein [Thelephora terrestris]|uniref:Kinase-like protein n=1 Tax=Thelephora terrestris TaxID=56493 RepID=A0A9P6L3Y3_9AGAM|nr:kinase-like protein [Thelephora terrestris]